MSVPSALALADRRLEGDRNAAKPPRRLGGSKRGVVEAGNAPAQGGLF